MLAGTASQTSLQTSAFGREGLVLGNSRPPDSSRGPAAWVPSRVIPGTLWRAWSCGKVALGTLPTGTPR